MDNTVELTSTPPIPSDAVAFKFPPGATWMLLLALLLAVAEAALQFLRAWNTPDPSTRLAQVPECAFFALVARLNWRLLRRSQHRIAVNANGIWSIHGSTIKHIPWLNLGRVKANDTAQRIELTDRSAASQINIEYQLKNFERLREFILAHTGAQAQLQNSGLNTFHRGWGRKLVYAGVGAVAIFAGWQIHLHDARQSPVLPFVVAAVALLIILREPVSLAIAQDAVVINYLGFQGTIPFSSITAITISDTKYRWNVWAGVVITTERTRRIRLTRFREGSVALYEALQSGWRQAAAARGFAIPSSATQPVDLREKGISLPAKPFIASRTWLALFIVVFLVAALSLSLSRGGILESIGERSLPASAYEKHSGPIAQASALQGNGRVYLVQLGRHTQPYSLDEFAKWLHARYAVDTRVLPAIPTDGAAWDVKRHQFVAEQLQAQIKQQHPDLAFDHYAYLIGFTDGSMYSTREMWGREFTQRDSLRTAVISAYGMGDTGWQMAHLDPNGAAQRLQARMRRILLKDVAVLYWHLPLNDDPTSLLHNPLDPDLPTEEIYQSDLDPASGPAGEKIGEPCIYFVYSIKEGIKPLPGPLIRDCGDVQDPMEDASVELFEFVPQLGLLIDKHTDFYLPDTIPIEFQRAIRDGERGRNPFGISGTDNYDDFLAAPSPDLSRILVIHDDGGRNELARYPSWVPSQSFVKFVSGPSELATVRNGWNSTTRRVWLYEMAYNIFPFEHYDLRRFNGGVETFLACSGSTVYCYLIDYHDSQGRELKFQRDNGRHLTRLTSPHGNWIGLTNAPDGRILSISDNKMRSVSYTYDPKNRLTRVTDPSGAVYAYEYDDEQHMLAFSLSPDGHSEPNVVLRNEYKNGLLTKQSFANGESYVYSYDSSNPDAVQQVKVYAPRGKVFDIEIGAKLSTVHENQP